MLHLKTALTLIVLLSCTSTLAAEYQSVLGFKYELPSNWNVLSPSQISQIDIDKAIRILGKQNGEKLINDVRAGRKEYFYFKTLRNKPVNDISIQLTQGELLKLIEAETEKCASINAKLDKYYGGKFELQQCQVDRSSKLLNVRTTYKLTSNQVIVRQQEFQITPGIVLVIASNSEPQFAREIRTIQDSISKTIIEYFAEYPKMHTRAASEYALGNFETSYALFLKLASLGDLEAEYNLGVMFELGQGVEKNYKNAFEYYSKAAGKGSLLAIWSMARSYHFGLGVNQDLSKALKLYKLAAESGLSSAQNSYGAMLLQGNGTGSNSKEAMRWFVKAVQQGNTEAAINLAELYKIEMASGNDDAAHALALLYLNGLTGKQKNEAGLDLLRKAAAAGHKPSIEKLYQIYSYGRFGIAPNPAEAEKWSQSKSSN